jgi:glutaredoxin
MVQSQTNHRRRRRMKAVVWSKPSCVYCEKSKALLKSKGIMYEEKNIAEGYDIQDLLELVPNAKTMPQIWLDEEHVGGFFELEKKLKD